MYKAKEADKNKYAQLFDGQRDLWKLPAYLCLKFIWWIRRNQRARHWKKPAPCCCCRDDWHHADIRRKELPGVLAHEIGHIKNRDMPYFYCRGDYRRRHFYIAMHLAVRWTPAIFGSMGKNNENQNGNIIELLVLAIIAPIIKDDHPVGYFPDPENIWLMKRSETKRRAFSVGIGGAED